MEISTYISNYSRLRGKGNDRVAAKTILNDFILETAAIIVDQSAQALDLALPITLTQDKKWRSFIKDCGEYGIPIVYDEDAFKNLHQLLHPKLYDYWIKMEKQVENSYSFEIIRDPSEKTIESYRVVCNSKLTTPSFNSMGAAGAYCDMIKNGTRFPEYS